MAFDARIRGIILSSVVLITGIIHFGVGIGIVAKYQKFHDVFEQQVGLSGFNIFIGLCTIIIAILGLVSILYQYPFLGRITAIAACVLGVITFISLIVALALSSQTASYLRDSISDNMNDYAEDDNSIGVIDKIQTTYQCCGVNLWLDWSRISLGSSSGIGNGRRRRRHSPLKVSPLTQALRKKRQTLTPGNTIYNLPSSYTINLPLSCCKNGGITVGNSLGGYCVFNAGNSSSSFYVRGCLEPVANIAFSQIAGIAVINTSLTILAFVYFAKLMKLFRNNADFNYSDSKQTNQYDISQDEQQLPYPYEQYYVNNTNPFPYYINNDATYKTYH